MRIFGAMYLVVPQGPLPLSPGKLRPLSHFFYTCVLFFLFPLLQQQRFSISAISHEPTTAEIFQHSASQTKERTTGAEKERKPHCEHPNTKEERREPAAWQDHHY